ncbi:MAG: SagB/ThcOx family dehydrogenase, partial [bacterium]
VYISCLTKRLREMAIRVKTKFLFIFLTFSLLLIFSFSDATEMYKNYHGKAKINLPPPDYKGLSLEETIKKRRSVRNFKKEPLSLKELSILLFAADGITKKEGDFGYRSAPSAGALYPIEIYSIVHNVDKLKQGIYHYSFLDHSLELIKEGNFKKEIVHAASDQETTGEAGVTFVLTSIWQRITRKYGERGYRYTFIEAGHIGQNIYLETVSLGLGCVAVGAFFDDELNKLLGIDGENESALYILSVGKIVTP